jgi:hypothetical protein
MKRKFGDDIQIEYYASSYVPTNMVESSGDTTILEDKYGLLKNNPDKWLNTLIDNYDGDLRSVQTINAIDEFFKDKKVDLYTSDAGIDVSSNYNNQELMNAKLHFGQMLSGLLSLKTGGTLLVKHYTLFEPQTINLILKTIDLFDGFYAIKPTTSRPVNSEVYLIGIGFKGISDETKAFMINQLATYNENQEQFSDTQKIPQSLANVILKLNEQQITYIEQNIRFINEFVKNKYYNQDHLNEYQLICQVAEDEYLEKCGLNK